MALAATDEDAPPQPAKAYFCWIYGAAEAAPFMTKFKNTTIPQPAGLPGLSAAAY